MVDYLVAGASSIEDIARFIDVSRNAGITVLLVENEGMWHHVPATHQGSVIRSQEIPVSGVPVIPLNEFWVSRAIQAEVENISPHALLASRSKHYLSTILEQNGVPALPRRFIEEIPPPGPLRYLARLDTGYSGYGIIRHSEAGPFDVKAIRRAVKSNTSATMRDILGENQVRVVVEDWLEGEEYSADVFVNNGRVVLLRLFRKIVSWINGRPVCDSYIAMPKNTILQSALDEWCAVLFSTRCISFGQFDFIVTNGRPLLVDFSCRIGGGLDSIKRFSAIPSYIAMALAGLSPHFHQYAVQKNVVAHRAGKLTHFELPKINHGQVTLHKQLGDLLPENNGSANARIADICFAANDFEDALAISKQLNQGIKIDVCD